MLDEVNLALGGLSYYIAIIYRFVIAGLILFIWITILLMKNTAPFFKIPVIDTKLREINTFLIYGRWVTIALMIDGIATAPITNMLTMVIMWFVYSLLIVPRSLIKNSLANETLLIGSSG